MKRTPQRNRYGNGQNHYETRSPGSKRIMTMMARTVLRRSSHHTVDAVSTKRSGCGIRVSACNRPVQCLCSLWLSPDILRKKSVPIKAGLFDQITSTASLLPRIDSRNSCVVPALQRGQHAEFHLSYSVIMDNCVGKFVECDVLTCVSVGER